MRLNVLLETKVVAAMGSYPIFDPC